MRKQINRGGRPATGHTRFKKFVLEMTGDEREYLFRKAQALRVDDSTMSQTGLILRRTFKAGWKRELDELRRDQKKLKIPFDVSAHA